MKKLIIASVFAAGGLMVTSCNSDLLDLNNPNTLVAQTAWNTQKDIENGLTGCYHTLYNCFYNSFNTFLISGQSDEFYSQSPDADLVDYIMLKYNNPDQRWNYYAWCYLYQTVFRCNQVIVYAEDVEWSSEVDKGKVVGQARALRGMSYYYLAMLWKKAPIVDWISAPSDQPAEATFEELVSFIEKDFLYAAENLPESFPEVGRMNKYFAYTFLGKLYMNSGQWEKAKAAFEVVITSGKYELAAEYHDNFRHTTNNNVESIWEIQNSDEVHSPFGGYWGIANDDAECNFTSWRERFISGSPYGFGDYAVYSWVIDMYKDEKDKDGNYDIRLRDNIVYPDLFKDFPGDIVYMTHTAWDATNWGNNAWCRKYSTDYYRDNVDGYSPINTRILRYGELLLSYAECLIEVGGASAIPEAAKYIDMIRERVNLYPLAKSVHKDCLNSLDAFEKRLRIEREKEICFEYDRFFDLRRWGLGTDTKYTNEVKARSSKHAANFTPGKEWLPIPLSEVSNNPNLTQNEGY
ncbi:RagB/SusD family nutrient uptake outer membrane protein [Phocaeicola plebeius]|uniref:RagB/SusD family nutrient uptake outer membrane protein n=1 Tax=Phocaeicola plebeius TaxID=310297 RepID=UPI0026ECF0E2|nr:RagB/SusD family nutrient uptake outer membrane protein [Phocaeicola plebeius]